MSTAPLEDRRIGAIPRTLPHDCKECGGSAPVLNGAYFRNLRQLAKLTIKEMARVCGVSTAYLSRMELGEAPFSPKCGELYERLFERRRKAGDYLDEEEA